MFYILYIKNTDYLESLQAKTSTKKYLKNKTDAVEQTKILAKKKVSAQTQRTGRRNSHLLAILHKQFYD